MRTLGLAIALAALSVLPAAAQNGRVTMPEVIEAVTLHRLFNQYYQCGEHFANELAICRRRAWF